MAAYEVLLLNTAVPQIQAAQSGDTYVVPRDIAFSAALTLSAGTANGVPYLNGSKVLTTGSALTFDGTTLQVSGGATGKVTSKGTTGQTILEAVTTSNIATLESRPDISYSRVTSSAYLLDLATLSNQPILFTVNSAEQMRLTSTGLGLGVTPSAWGSSYRALQVGGSGISAWTTSGSGGNLYLSNNVYFDGSNRRYIANAAATEYEAGSVGHVWKIAASGTLGNAISFTQAMTLDASENLLVGTTSSSLMGGKSLKIDGGTDTTGGQYSFLAYHSNASYYFGLNNNGYVQSSAVYGRTTASAANVNVDASGYITRSTSARKYKQDIRDIEEMDISLLRPVRYKSKCESDDQTKDHLGVIADEAAGAGFEELVTRGADGEVEGFQYERLTVVLLKELQSLRARVAQLESKGA